MAGTGSLPSRRGGTAFAVWIGLGLLFVAAAPAPAQVADRPCECVTHGPGDTTDGSAPTRPDPDTHGEETLAAAVPDLTYVDRAADDGDDLHALHLAAGHAPDTRGCAAPCTGRQKRRAVLASCDRGPPAPGIQQLLRCGGPAELGALELGRAFAVRPA
jgi:hypothetical protein